MVGKKGQKKRVWSDDERRTICAQTLTPGVLGAQVARRYSMNANLIFKWLEDPRFASSASAPSPEGSVALEGVFLPIESDTPAHARPSGPARMNAAADEPGSAVMAQRVEITLSDGRRILVEDPLRHHRLQDWFRG